MAFRSWCFATGPLVPDLDLIAAKGKGGHFALWLGLHPEDERRARDAARPFDWSTEWVRRVVGNALLLACLTRAGSLDLLTVEDLDAVEDAIADSAVLTRIGRVHLSAQYRGLRNLCYQLRVTDSPPVHDNTHALAPAQRAAVIVQPEFRRAATAASRSLPRSRLKSLLNGPRAGHLRGCR